ncbi:MAG: nicotinate (nicotinamide) nucleotide adenylyltransferase, partial [Flavobacteriales bacterium]
FFGSFNPIHRGHTRIAEEAVKQGFCEEVWFVVSPHNPFKSPADLAPVSWRISLAKTAIQDLPFAKVCEVELELTQPTYTCNTLRVLFERFPDHSFLLLIGEDQLPRFREWQEADWIMDHIMLLVYPRGKYVASDIPHHRISCETMDISSTLIRDRIAKGESTEGLLDARVSELVVRNNLYR